MSIVICKARQSILDESGHVLVTGGPGCGKTTIALVKAKMRIENGILNGQAVLFLSFSRAAVARIVEASKSQIAKTFQEKLQIQTFHSFFWEILRANGYLLGAPRKLKILLPHDERALRFGARDETAEWATEREQLFHARGIVAFDLFASKTLAILQGSKVIRRMVCERFPLIIVDEAQDTAEDQWECLKLLSTLSQIICLADLDQQIYEFRTGVSSKRVIDISDFLKPLPVDLGSENNRSPTNDIVAFGNDIMLSRPRGSPYKGVSRRVLPPRAAARDSWIRKSVGIIWKSVRDATGKNPQTVGFLASWGKGVSLISNALRGTTTEKEIRHEVIFDEGEVFLASQAIAYCLEPRSRDTPLQELSVLFELIVPVLHARGTATSMKEAAQLHKWACEARSGKIPKGAAAKKGIAILEQLRAHSFLGSPLIDWRYVQELFRGSGAQLLQRLVVETEHVISFDRGRRITAGLVEVWQQHGSYVSARNVLNSVLAQEHLLFGIVLHRGLSVMTIHKAKGKEFDGVIIIDDSRLSPLASVRETAPYPKSRRLLRVGITRARHHTLLLTDVATPCPLLDGHKF